MNIKRIKKIYHLNNTQKNAVTATLLSDKIDFRRKIATTDKLLLQGNFITKGSIHQEAITIIKIYVPYKKAKINESKINFKWSKAMIVKTSNNNGL